MKIILLILSFFMLTFSVHAKGVSDIIIHDSTEVKTLNRQAFEDRLTDPAQTIVTAGKALAIAQKLNYTKGIAEAYRVTGLGQYYMNQLQESIKSYINALTVYQQLNDLHGVGKIYNNIGVLYRDNDYDKSLEFFNKALALANSLHDKPLLANVYLNLGTYYYKKISYYRALSFYDQSEKIFGELKDSVNVIQCSQNRGVAYFRMHQLDMAEKILLDAHKKAEERDLNESVASIDLTLASVYIAMNKYSEAEQFLSEGTAYSKIIKDDKLAHDFKYTEYELEYKRKNYGAAVDDLREVYHQDSVDKKNQVTAQLMLSEVRHTQEEQLARSQITEKDNQYERARFWGVTSVAGLLLLLVGVLISNVKRKAKTNSQLTDLNAEVLKQKDNLDRVNHHLEEIIDERTKDLQTKNRKLSDYSSYLSHQIRGPIATLKGLMNLEKEGLVDKNECIKMMDKCVSEIDSKIIEMSEMMHDPGKAI